MARGLGAKLLTRDQYDRRYIIGKYTPTLPDHIHTRMARARAARAGLCIECCRNERDGEHSHCRVCLDDKAKYRRVRSKEISSPR